MIINKNADHYIRPITTEDIDPILNIENECYSHPWSRGNFIDSLKFDHYARALLLSKSSSKIIGYYFSMAVLDEMHLLNITISKEFQAKGYGKYIIENLIKICKCNNISSIFLEVRKSNLVAKKFYEKFNFKQLSERKGYYPARNNMREDAIVMQLKLHST